jgi:hypothetical protein
LVAAAVFGAVISAEALGFRGLYGSGGILPYYGYGYGSSCYALTPYGYAWICT